MDGEIALLHDGGTGQTTGSEEIPVESGLWRTREHRSGLGLLYVKHSGLPFTSEPALGWDEVLDQHQLAELSQWSW